MSSIFLSLSLAKKLESNKFSQFLDHTFVGDTFHFPPFSSSHPHSVWSSLPSLYEQERVRTYEYIRVRQLAVFIFFCSRNERSIWDCHRADTDRILKPLSPHERNLLTIDRKSWCIFTSVFDRSERARVTKMIWLFDWLPLRSISLRDLCLSRSLPWITKAHYYTHRGVTTPGISLID